MPHIIIEHDEKTKNEIDLSKLAKSLHLNLASQDTIKLEAIKTRTVELKNVIVGTGASNRMIHIEVLLLEGRSQELKEYIAQELFNLTQIMLQDLECALTVNIAELGVYKK
jgi:5-carboxymethyl-2-hydroxymuconate isomerase